MKRLILIASMIGMFSCSQNPVKKIDFSDLPAEAARLFEGTAEAAPQGNVIWFSEAEALTRASPVGTDPRLNALGARMRSATGWRTILCAAPGQTLSGAGNIMYYLWEAGPANATPLEWARNPGIDDYVNVTATGANSCSGAACRCNILPSHSEPAPVDGWLEPATNGITVSSGTVTVYVALWSLN